MSNPFYDHPILNSPYEYPSQHWELDQEELPTQRVIATRRRAKYVTPIPQPKKRKPGQRGLGMDEGHGLSTDEQNYETTSIVNEIRAHVDQWRKLPNPNDWLVTPETVRLLQHWRHHRFSNERPFFCQVEAVETAIWLGEVAPKGTKAMKGLLEHVDQASHDSNPELRALALKLATGAGKTTVMAMLIAWQTINEARSPGSKLFTRGFLLVTPGLTVKDRLRVLQPSDLNNYYEERELVPPDLMPELKRAKVVVANYHAFKLREELEVAKGTRRLLLGSGEALQTIESEGKMIQRVMPELMGLKNILVINDEAHHCYREKPGEREEGDLKGEDKEEAKKNSEAARLWISGLEAVNRKLGVNRVLDLSATPFFLRGSGYAEGTLFHWTASDFSLMDAIECGIVKLPRVPVADNIPGAEVPIFRNLWDNIRSEMPRKGRSKASDLDPLLIPNKLQTALEALYGHYEKVFHEWEKAGIAAPPCFIVVCNNTSASKLVYDYISGFSRTDPDGTEHHVPGRLALFQNADENGSSYARPRTILVDSEQLESGEGLDDNFRSMAAAEIEVLRRETVARTGEPQTAEDFTDQELLRGVLNTVGKQGRLGESIRCVVSVSMLTEGWDANTVTHVLGVRAFGTQLLCEQVIGRALRRQSYQLNSEGKFNVEYADVLGIPFDFTAKPVVPKPQAPLNTTRVEAVSPERDHLEIRFPRVSGYRVELPEERLTAIFNADSTLELNQGMIGPSNTRNEGIIGDGVDLTLKHTADARNSTILYHLTQHLLYTRFRDPGEEPKLYLFGQLKRIAKEWMEGYLKCTGGVYPAQLLNRSLADRACERIMQAINRGEIESGGRPVKAVLDPYNPTGSTPHVRFNTTRSELYRTDARRCPINYVVDDSGWEGELCRVVESHERVRAYVKNHNLGFEAPYRCGSETRRYLPDFIVLVEDGQGEGDLLQLIVEIKGFRNEDAKDKKSTMETYWIPGVNNNGQYGRWAFAEFTKGYEIESDFDALIHSVLQPVSV